MATKIDVRGLSCPVPVVMTKKALEDLKEDVLEVLVDNPTAKENVTRFAKSSGFKVDIINLEGEYILKIMR